MTSNVDHPSVAAPIATMPIWRQFYALMKPRVIQLIVFCALIGMVLAVPGVPSISELQLMGIACLGIWLVSGAAAAFNCVVESHIDAKMRRTSWRPTAKGELSNRQTLTFSALLCAAGSLLLYVWVNPLTMWLTFATFVGYAVIYTVVLKPLTPQNIVIGGASGAMPPVLGWAAMANGVGHEAFILFLIIFLWTPPPFLGPGALPRRRLSQERTTDVARDAWVRIYPLTNTALHTHLGRSVFAAVYGGHERLALPLCGGGVVYRVYGLCGGFDASLFRCTGA